MKQRICILLVPLLVAGMMAGCADRNSASSAVSLPASSASVLSESDVENVSSSLPESSSAPAESAPAFSEAEQAALEGDVLRFLQYFGNEPIAGAADLPTKQALAYCLAYIDQVKEDRGYYFETNDAGVAQIPQDLVATVAEQMLGISDFAPEDVENYIAEPVPAYTYAPGKEPAKPDATLSPFQSADGNLVCDVKADGNSVQYTFRLMKLNGLPYLQFFTAETV